MGIDLREVSSIVHNRLGREGITWACSSLGLLETSEGGKAPANRLVGALGSVVEEPSLELLVEFLDSEGFGILKDIVRIVG